MKKIEAKFGLAFQKWATKNFKFPPSPVFWEYKHTRGKKAFPFREWYDHQRNWSQVISGEKPKFYRIGDYGPQFKMCDAISVCFSEYNIPIQYNDFFVVIGGDVLHEEIKKSDKKSLSEKRAKEIAFLVVDKNLAPY